MPFKKLHISKLQECGMAVRGMALAMWHDNCDRCKRRTLYDLFLTTTPASFLLHVSRRAMADLEELTLTGSRAAAAIYTQHQYEVEQVLALATSSFSFVMGTFALYCFARMKRTFRHQ